MRSREGAWRRTFGLVEVVRHCNKLWAGKIVRECLALCWRPIPRTREPGLFQRNEMVLYVYFSMGRLYDKMMVLLTMSRSLARVVGTPSYGETQFPDVGLHELSVTTFVPSRMRTVSRVSQLPDTEDTQIGFSGETYAVRLTGVPGFKQIPSVGRGVGINSDSHYERAMSRGKHASKQYTHTNVE